jgi:hypothetical protein
MPFLLPPLPPDPDRGGGRAALAGSAPGAAAAGDRGKRRGQRGVPSPIPTLGWGALEGRIDGQRRAARGGGRGDTGGGDGGLGGEEEMVVEVRGATESHTGPFIVAGRR